MLGKAWPAWRHPRKLVVVEQKAGLCGWAPQFFAMLNT
jgi:hypothetical protein